MITIDDIKERSTEGKVDYLIEKYALQTIKIDKLDKRIKKIEEAFT